MLWVAVVCSTSGQRQHPSWQLKRQGIERLLGSEGAAATRDPVGLMKKLLRRGKSGTNVRYESKRRADGCGLHGRGTRHRDHIL